MNIERFSTPGLAQFAYIVSSGDEAVIIDPMRDIDCYLRYLADEELVLTYVMETHIHADFVSGARAIAQATAAELVLSAHDEGEHYRYSMPHRALRNGDSVTIGSVRLEALYTPGHTPEHLSYILFDGKRSATEPLALFSGDFLFVGSVGRPDLLGDAAKTKLARDLYLSLHQTLATLPDSVQIYPGHGAGSLCGAGLGERAESTLGYERKTNPLFQLAQDLFVREVLSSVPPMPSYYPRMKELNAAGASAFGADTGAKPISTVGLQSLMVEGKVIVLDLRRPEAFGGAHIPGAINMGAGQNLSLWAGWLLSPDSRIVLVNDMGDDQQSRRALQRVGLDGVIGYLSGGMPAWIQAGYGFQRTIQLSAAEMEKGQASAFVLDVRSDAEWQAGHIAGANHMMLGNLADQVGKLPRDQPIIVVCGSGYRSSIAAGLLSRAGFEDVMSVDGGMTAWNKHLLRIASNRPELVEHISA